MRGTPNEQLLEWGRRARAARGDRPLREIAVEGGITKASLSRIENGLMRPSDDTKVALARALGRRTQDLFPLDEQVAS